MMFKGSARFGPGEIDRLTQALGGVNNAFTSHDATAYYFNFAADRWTEALAIEADRMTALTLDPEQVASERQVILEEIAMYDSEPWDALEMAVHNRLFAGHPYGHPVLGTREELLATGAEDLRAFHRRFYRPDNAVLVVAGDIGDGALDAVERRARRHPRRRASPAAASTRRPCSPPASSGWNAARGKSRACSWRSPRRTARTPIIRPCVWRPPCSAAAAPAACSTPWSRRSRSASGCRPISPRGWTPA